MQLSQAKKKLIRSLSLKKNRDEQKLFVAEGEKVIGDIMDGGIFPQFVVYQSDVEPSLKFSSQTEMLECSGNDMQAISNMATAPGALAVFKQWNFDLRELEKPSPRWLITDGIKDPGNMGTLIRTAHWFGVDAIIAINSCAELYNPKTIQSSMGSLGKIPVFYMEAELFFGNHKGKTRFIGADLEGDTLSNFKAEKSFALIIGSESHGLSEIAKRHLTQKVFIPAFDSENRPESLNAAVSAGIILSRIAG